MDNMTEGFVLVGGASSRMGRNKAQMVIGGRKLFERSANGLTKVCHGNVTLVGDMGSDFDCELPIIRDIGSESPTRSRAPVIGLLTALKFAKTAWIAILACDLPFVTAESLTRLASYRSNERDAVVPVQPDGRPQTLCAFYRRETCLPIVEAMVTRGDLKMQGLLSYVRTRFVRFDEIADLPGSADFFVNVNEPEDYEKAVARTVGV